MCNIPVNLPTVASFLMLYSLKCGCLVIFAWTMFRALFCIAFLVVTIILMYMPNSEHPESQPTPDSFYFVFPSYIILIVTECFVFMFAIYLAVGIYSESSFRVQQYLICRFCAFLFEAIALVCLCFNHQYYIGWYLVFLMIIILELYSFIVVYSYFAEMAQEQEVKECECEDTELNFESELSGSFPETRASLSKPQLLDMRKLRSRPEVPEPRDTRAPRFMPESRTPRTPALQDTRPLIYTPEPRAPRCTPELPDTRTTRDIREIRGMQNVRDIMPDFRDPRCTRKMDDPKLGL